MKHISVHKHTTSIINAYNFLTGGHSNLTKRLHRHRTWTVQSFTNVNLHLTHASLDPPDRFSRFHTTHCRDYMLQWATLRPHNFPFTSGDLDLHIIHGSLDPASITQTASWVVQPFLHGSQLWETDHAALSVTTGHIYIVLRCGLNTRWKYDSAHYKGTEMAQITVENSGIFFLITVR